MTLAIDGTQFFRGYRTPFWAQLAVAIDIPDNKGFEDSYSSTIGLLKKKYGITKNRKVLTSHFLSEVMEDENEKKQLLKEFARKICDEIDKVYILHTIIPSSRIPSVMCYNGASQVPPVEFVKSLGPTYTHCVLWKLMSDGLYKKSTLAQVDNFEGDITDAWEEIATQKPNARIFFSGDNCNPAISTADLLCKHVDYALRDKSLQLGNQQLETCFADSGLEITPIFLDDLTMITPRVKKPIDIRKFAHHPIIFVFGSQVIKSERKVIESVGMFDKIANLAFDNGACLKFFDYDHTDRDASFMGKGDILLGVGDNGMTTANYFKNDLNLDVKVIKTTDIEKKT